MLDAMAQTGFALVEDFVDANHLIERDVADGVRADAIARIVSFPHQIEQFAGFETQHALFARDLVRFADGGSRAAQAAVGEELDRVDAQRRAEVFFRQAEK